MDGVRPKALFASRRHWSSRLTTGMQHLGRGLAKDGWQVAFVCGPITPFHFLAPLGADLGARFALYRRGGKRVGPEGIWAYNPAGLLAPGRLPPLRSEWVDRNWRRFTLPRLPAKVAANGFGEVDVICLETTSQSFWLDVLPHRLSVYRFDAEEAAAIAACPALAERHERLIGRVDVVACTGRDQTRRARDAGARQAIHLPDGVDFWHFASGSRDAPAEYESIERPIAVCLAAADWRMATSLINHAAENLTHVSFVIIGPGRRMRKRLANLPNVHTLAQPTYEKLPAYLTAADVGIIPVDRRIGKQLIGSVNPPELLELLACGLPVVATEFEELRAMASPAALCDIPPEFVDQIRMSLAREHDAETFRRYAAEADWPKRIAQLREAIGL